MDTDIYPEYPKLTEILDSPADFLIQRTLSEMTTCVRNQILMGDILERVKARQPQSSVAANPPRVWQANFDLILSINNDLADDVATCVLYMQSRQHEITFLLDGWNFNNWANKVSDIAKAFHTLQLAPREFIPYIYGEFVRKRQAITTLAREINDHPEESQLYLYRNWRVQDDAREILKSMAKLEKYHNLYAAYIRHHRW